MPMQTGGRTHEGAGQCLYPSPHAEEGKLLMCVERVSSEEGNNMCQRAKPAQAGWLNTAAMKSGDKCIKRGESFCRCRGQVWLSTKAEKTCNISGLINTGCQSLQTQAALVFAD